MDYFNILGIKEGASKEEIRQAYEKQVSKFNNDINDEKRLKKFLKLFKEAHDTLIEEIESKEEATRRVNAIEEITYKNKHENSDNDNSRFEVDNKNEYDLNHTVKMSADEIQEFIRKSKQNNLNERPVALSKEEFFALDDNEYEDEEIEDKRKVNVKNKVKSKARKKSNKSSKEKSDISKKTKEKNSSKNDNRDKENVDERITKKRNNSDLDTYGSEEREVKRNKNQRVSRKSNNRGNGLISLIKIPFKILALPIILILSIVIFTCKIINLACFLVSKVIIIGAIALASIHGYQIYMGQAMQWKIFALCAGAAIVSLFLPVILKVLPNMLEKINNSLKNFVF